MKMTNFCWRVGLLAFLLVISRLAYAPEVANQCNDDEFSCGDGKCIPSLWVCDEMSDCSNGNDEQTCSNQCNDDEFSCGDGKCIPSLWVCDETSDCSNGNDEQTCSNPCNDDEFSCGDGKCIPSLWVCDEMSDCSNGNDEQTCSSIEECTSEHFKCNNSQCIPAKWHCDGTHDCEDHSDEFHCESLVPKCDSEEWNCATFDQCIHLSWRCDGDNDCIDETDEVNCTHTCASNEFKCDNGQCINSTLRCDGEIECADASDEADCVKNCDNATQFGCQTETGFQCLTGEKVCDGYTDCFNEEDEYNCTTNVNPCLEHNGGCAQRCVRMFYNEFRCECDDGYRLVGQSSCEDINECEPEDVKHKMCSQGCQNYQGGYECSCIEGYTLDPHGICRINGIRPYLLLANRFDIRTLQVDTWREQTVLEDLTSVVAVDFDYDDGYLFWTDIEKKQIFSARKVANGPAVDEKVIVSDNVKTPDGIAVDWIYNHVYWTDANFDKIEVMRYDGQMRRNLVTEGLDEPRAIVVDPLEGWMYWTDWGQKPMISRCGLNGKYQSIIVQENIEWPNGLTIDYVERRLFWIDAKLKLIRSVDTNGESPYTVLHDAQSIIQPFAITVFEDDLYWTDWRAESIRTVNKFRGDGYHQVRIGLHSPMDIHFFHKHVQKNGTNRCGTDNGQCSDFCLPSPHRDDVPNDLDKANGYSCACRNHYKLGSDQKTCVPDIVDVSTTTTNTVSTATNTQTTPISDASTTVVPASTPATRSDIECLTNSISLHIPLGLLPTGQQVTWQDPSCVVADNGTHLVGTIGLGDCGTYVVFNSSHVTFENELVSSAGSTSTTTSGIDYGSESNSVIVVQCVYPRRETGSTAFRPVQGHVRFFEKTIGHMQVHMRQARDATFADIYPSQTEPREVHLNDKLYIKLTADQGSPVKVAINVDRCLATPSPSPLDTEYQELTNNGCPAIPSVSIHNSSSSEVHLSFRAFQFRSHPGAPVYVHCEVYVCPLSHPQCVAGCTNIAAARTRRAALSDVKSHLVSTGPFPVTNEKEQGAFGGQSIALIAVTGLCACLAVVATVFGILAWKGMRRQAKEIN